ncbi:phosphohydrolase [Deinococcus taeanensis]|uniref:HD domain-containing protein n=1 Tax=Deinococcus taeanensis TaxID=2737050 RepID=UPI001CDD474C|nr:phosphohydrolase [Deinococcus taeanensis]UBV42442.1 phosphohydrolase [Deinococcus taeanensis]
MAALTAAAEAFARPWYAEAGRTYHTAEHVQAMLGALRSRGVLTAPLELAAWGHDLIYDPRAADNEARSAAVFCAWLAAQGAPPALSAQVHALILATRHAEPPATREEALFVDADLAVLGADPATFAAYDHAIRAEYAHVPDGAYRIGRSAVLRHFLERQPLYTTPEFAALDAPARVNLRRALARLAPAD